MEAWHAEILIQLIGAGNAGQILRQRIRQRIVHTGQTLCAEEHQCYDDKNHDNALWMLGDNRRHLMHMRCNNRMAPFFDDLVKVHNERRQNGQGTDYAERNALRHNDTNICAQCQRHRAHCQKSGDGCQGRGQNGRTRQTNGGHHRILIGFICFFLLIAVQQENAEVHRYTQLQNRRERLCDIGNLSHKHIAAKVIYNRKNNAQHKDERHGCVFQKQEQHNQAEYNGTQHVFRQFLIDQLLGVLQNRGHAAEKTVFFHNAFDLHNGVDGFVRRAGLLKPHHHHG